MKMPPRLRFESLPTWLVASTLAAILASAPIWAHAGVGGALADWATDKATAALVGKAVDAIRGPAAMPVKLPPASSLSACAGLFPKNVPLDLAKVDAAWRPRALCANHYAVVHSGLSRTPLLVIERLTREQLNDALDEQRTEEFFADSRLPASERAELSDYSGSGYDRGHLAPAADMPDVTSMAQSFALSNMVPQDATNNRKVWSKVESDTRKYVRRASGNVFVFSGPLFKGARRTVGANRVWVPSHLFKLVYDEQTGRVWAHILANSATAQVGAPVDYAAFVKETGWAVLGAPAAATASR